MTDVKTQMQLAEAQAMVQALQEELKETQQGLLVLTMELEQRVEARTTELRTANAELQRDIAERRRAEEALRQSEERFRMMVEGARDYAIFMLDPAGNVATWNAGAQRLKGYSAEEIIGKHFSCFYPPEDPGKPQRELAIAAAEGQYVEEHWRLRKDGSRFWASATITALRNDDGSLRGYAKITQDLTQRKAAENSLRDSEERYRSLFNSMTEGFALHELITDSNGNPADYRFIDINPAFERMTGLKREAVMGKTVLQVLPDIEPEWIQVYGKVALSGDPVHFDRFAAPLGKHYEVFAYRPAPMQFAVIFMDVTERKRAENDLRRTTEELARSNRDLEQFAYVASHDLREPLRMVSAYTELLGKRYQGQLDAKADEYIAFAVDGAQRMQALIDGLLAYSRVGTSSEPAPVQAREALDTALANLQAAVEASGATITHDPMPTVVADSLQLTQVFQNLIGNAIKYRRPGASPVIHIGAKRVIGHSSLGKSPSDKGETSSPADQGPMANDQHPRANDQWLFSVRDNGIGIDPQFAERVFQIFQRLHTRDEYEGTGIGLAICKKIVARHGGRIWLESQPGQGATFFFTLPAELGTRQ